MLPESVTKVKQLHSAKNKITPRQTGKHQHLLTIYIYIYIYFTQSQQHQPPLIKKKKKTIIIRKITQRTGHYLLLFSYMINPISLWSPVLVQ